MKAFISGIKKLVSKNKNQNTLGITYLTFLKLRGGNSNSFCIVHFVIIFKISETTIVIITNHNSNAFCETMSKPLEVESNLILKLMSLFDVIKENIKALKW